jgi:hypothetical protein
MVITLCCGGSPGLIMVVRLYIRIFLFFSSKMFRWYHSPCYFQLAIHNRDSISYFESQDSVVSIAARLWVQILWVRFLTGARVFPLLQNIQTCSGAHWASCSLGTTILSPRIKRQERQADHLTPCTAKVKNVQNCTSAPAYVLMAFRGTTVTFLCILFCTLWNTSCWQYRARLISWDEQRIFIPWGDLNPHPQRSRPIPSNYC